MTAVALPHEFWQALLPAGAVANAGDGFFDAYPAALPDRRQLLLPIRVLPGDGKTAVASLIFNQASFAVQDALADAVATLLRDFAPEVIVGVPTLGLTLAEQVARRLGHARLVPLGTSRKFWYSDALAEPISSITSPDRAKTLFIDPRMLPLLADKRIAVVDDVISSGTSMASVLRLLGKVGATPVGIGAAMLQGTRWQQPLAAWRDIIVAPLQSPRLRRDDGRWVADDASALPAGWL